MITVWYLVLILGVGSSSSSVVIPQPDEATCESVGDAEYKKAANNTSWTKIGYYFCVPGVMK